MANLIPSSGIPSLTVGGRVFTDLANLIVLTGLVGGVANSHCAARKGNGTAGYAIAATKTYKISAIKWESQTPGFIAIGYCDNDVGFATNTAPTNPVFWTANVITMGTIAANNAAYTVFEKAIDFQVPAGKYLYISAEGNGTGALVTAFGYEV